MYTGGWLILARFVQFTFIGLVGVSLALSHSNYKKQFNRGLFVLLCGMLITVVTYIAIPEQFVRFGILHLIGFSIIILAPIAQKRYLALILGIIAFAAAKPINELLNIETFSSVDYFEIFPWISIVLVGIFLGNFLRDKIKDKKNPSAPKLTTPVVFLGQHSLLIYMIHIPLILLILIALNIVPFNKIQQNVTPDRQYHNADNRNFTNTQTGSINFRIKLLTGWP
jgi:uncharacterized membrane protein